MKNYWISWETKPCFGAFSLHFPWWISGYGIDSDPTICAAIQTDMNPDDFIRLSYDRPPRDIQFRFIEERPDDWSPFSERFPKAGWMQWGDYRNYASLIGKKICCWCNEIEPKSDHDKTCAKTFKPKKYNYGWISTTEELPDESKWVLIYCGRHPEPKGIYQARRLVHSDLSYTYYTFNHKRLLIPCEVTHWMPLPETPK